MWNFEAEFLKKKRHVLKHGLSRLSRRNEIHGKSFRQRLNPTLFGRWCKVCHLLLYNYFPKVKIDEINNFKISKYAYGEDYHEVIKDILKEMVAELQEEIGEFGFRVFVDSAPVLEKSMG